MRKHIGIQLASRVAVLFLVFSVVMSSLFYMLYDRQVTRQIKKSMKRDAYNIAKSITIDIEAEHVPEEKLASYLYAEEDAQYLFLLYERLIKSEVWLVDKGYNVVTHQRDALNYYENMVFSASIEKRIARVFLGETICEDVDNEHFLAGTPIMDGQGKNIGALLLYTSIKNVNKGFHLSMLILLSSVVIALVLILILVIRFSQSFTKPIKKIGKVSMEMANGNYEIKTGIQKQDEIGMLSESIDILASRLEEARLESMNAETVKREFLSKISHELKTPVTIIRGTLDALAEKIKENPAETISYVEQMQGEILWLQKMIQDLFDLTRLQSAEFQLNPTEFDLGELIGDVLMSARILAKRKNIWIKCEPPQKEISVVADYDRIRQLFMIFLDNAIKYSYSEGIIEMGIYPEERMISIKDYGCGISEEALELIFNPYYRERDNRGVESTGLGLAIAMEIARRHHIKIEVQSKLGEGTTFFLQFPDEEKNKSIQ